MRPPALPFPAYLPLLVLIAGLLLIATTARTEEQRRLAVWSTAFGIFDSSTQSAPSTEVVGRGSSGLPNGFSPVKQWKRGAVMRAILSPWGKREEPHRMRTPLRLRGVPRLDVGTSLRLAPDDSAHLIVDLQPDTTQIASSPIKTVARDFERFPNLPWHRNLGLGLSTKIRGEGPALINLRTWLEF